MEILAEFFFRQFRYLPLKTRSTLDFLISGFFYRLLREPVYSIFCNGTSTVTPEDCFDGKIILINLPVKNYHGVGRDCQILFKYIWQRAMEKRNISKNPRPVFLFADEAQNFLHEHDAVYQATARSSRICTVYISQNLPNYYAAMGGGANADAKVKSFTGTLGTKIYHANADIESNRWASEIIGDGMFDEFQQSITTSTNASRTDSVSGRYDRLVRPEDFSKLRTGGERNRYRVQAYIHVQGDPLFNGENYKKAAFNQKFTVTTKTK